LTKNNLTTAVLQSLHAIGYNSWLVAFKQQNSLNTTSAASHTHLSVTSQSFTLQRVLQDESGESKVAYNGVNNAGMKKCMSE